MFLLFFLLIHTVKHFKRVAVLAQPVERVAFNHVVVGSIPTDGDFSMDRNAWFGICIIAENSPGDRPSRRSHPKLRSLMTRGISGFYKRAPPIKMLNLSLQFFFI